MATTITSENLKICMLNFYLRHDNFEHNVRLIERLLELSVDQMPDIIVTPELAVSGYCFYNELGVGWIATEVPKVVKKISRWTKQHEIELIWRNPHYLLQIEPVFQFGIFYRRAW